MNTLTLRRMVPAAVPCSKSPGRVTENAPVSACGRLSSVGRMPCGGGCAPLLPPTWFTIRRAVVDVGERIGAGVLGLLEGVGDGAVEVVAEPPVQPDVEAPDVAEVQVGQDPEVVVAALRRVVQADQTGGRIGHDVLVVGGDVQHHVVVERVPDAELEGDGLAEVEVGAEDLVGVGVAQVDVDPAQQQAEVRRLHLVRVADSRKLVRSVTGNDTCTCGLR